MSAEKQRAEAFVGRLLDNPAVTKYTPLQKEEHIVQFLRANSVRLAPALQSQSFFPGYSWERIFSVLRERLAVRIDEELAKTNELVLDRMINWEFVSFTNQSSESVERARDETRTLLQDMLEQSDARRALTGAYAAVYFGLARRYLEHVYARRSYIHFELTKVQRLRMGKEQVQGLVDLSMLLKPAIYLVSTSADRTEAQRGGLIEPQLADTAKAGLKTRAPNVPEQAISSAVHANVSFLDHSFVDATARVAAIFSARGRSFHPGITVEKGADTPDKSWLSTAKRNCRFYGFDAKMLDELYSAAAENAW
ncbi:MAG: hypothetical protein ACLFM0_07890 [Spirochaetales bacterium]